MFLPRFFLPLCALSLVGVSTLHAQKNLMPALPIEDLAPFHVKMKGNEPVSGEGKKPTLWTAVCWQPDSTGEVFFSGTDVNGHKAIGLRNLEGEPALQFYHWQPVQLAVGARYKVALTYLSENAAKGRLTVRFKDQPALDFPLPDSQGEWKTVENTFEATDPALATFFICPISVEADAVLYLREITLVED